MGSANGVHHLALYTENIKAQIAFFTDVLGAELKALYWLHGMEGWCHGFVKLNDYSYIAFMQGPKKEGSVDEKGALAPPKAGGFGHLALNVSSREELLALRDRIRSRGVPAVGPINHGFCESIYFGGPEMLQLEIACSSCAIDEHAWIDPEVVALENISEEQLRTYIEPAHFARPPIAVEQPQPGPTTPVPLLWQGDELVRVLRTSDAVITSTMSEPKAPVSTVSS